MKLKFVICIGIIESTYNGVPVNCEWLKLRVASCKLL